MRLQHTLLTAFLLLVLSSLHTSSEAQCPTLLWSDEFNGTTVNTSNWNIDVGGGGFGNNEKQYYTSRSNNVQVGGGQLTITALSESYGGESYTSGKLTSYGK